MNNRVLFLIILAFVATTMSFSQTEVRKYTPVVTADGIVYSLPQTELMIAITATRVTEHPGEFHAYAQRYLRLNDAVQAEKTTWTIDGVQVVNYCKPDTSKTFMIAFNRNSSAPLCTMTEDGILLSINAQGQRPQIGSLTDIRKAPSTTKLNSKDYLNPEILMAGSELKMAELTVEKIYQIREKREELVNDESDDAPKDAEQLKEMLSRLDQQEANLLQLFKGYTSTETKTWFVNYTPGANQRDIIARFSDQSGVVDKSDLSGAPVYITIANQNTTTQGQSVITDKKIVDHSIRYNVPSQAIFDINFNGQSLKKFQIPVAQYGHVEYLTEDLFNKRATCRIWFNGLTGNIEKIEDDNLKK